MTEHRHHTPRDQDAAPREYPDMVTLVRRADSGPATAPAATTIAEIRAWLLHEALREDDFLLLLQEFCWRMVAAGLPVDRVTVHVGTLHPQLLGFYWFWKRSDGLVDELQVDNSGFDAVRYHRSPLAAVIERGEPFRASTNHSELARRYPLLDDLAREGIRDYCVLPLSTGKTYHNAITLATCRDSGFDEAELLDMKGLFEIFAIHIERQILHSITVNVLDTYLGNAARRKVLSGSIRRGTGETITAIVWMSDLRGFSGLSDRLPGADVLALLNAYFERLTRAVTEHGGEILKFIGDGLLAVFPLDQGNGERSAARRALAAARQALQSVEALNREPAPDLDHNPDWRPLKTGIALHYGEVFFGNVGGPGRLDFTVIGRIVNEVSRVESLTKELDRPILLTEPVARLIDTELELMGYRELRGVSERIGIFSCPVAPENADAKVGSQEAT
jgi:adenylate cyclase